jgi:mRNA interferase RelE/StbE
MYKIVFARAARQELESLSVKTQDRVLEAIEGLRNDPRRHGSKKLKGTASTYRIRVGHYRVVYEVLDKDVLVLIVRVRHRKDAYK